MASRFGWQFVFILVLLLFIPSRFVGADPAPKEAPPDVKEKSARWDKALATEDTAKLVKPETLRQAFMLCRLDNGETRNYGFGWVITRSRGGLLHGHGGRFAGFCSYIGRYINARLTVVVLSNDEPFLPRSKPAEEIADQIADVYLSTKATPSK
jgi:hypothetical protein